METWFQNKHAEAAFSCDAAYKWSKINLNSVAFKRHLSQYFCRIFCNFAVTCSKCDTFRSLMKTALRLRSQQNDMRLPTLFKLIKGAKDKTKAPLAAGVLAKPRLFCSQSLTNSRFELFHLSNLHICRALDKRPAAPRGYIMPMLTQEEKKASWFRMPAAISFPWSKQRHDLDFKKPVAATV